MNHPMPKERSVRRIEDMSSRGYLELLIEDDGDIIIVTHGMRGDLIEPGSAVQFCAPITGGGHSPHTRLALFALMAAIEKDNAENPIIRPGI